MGNFIKRSAFRNQVIHYLFTILVLLLVSSSVFASGNSLTLWGKQTKGWGMKNAEITGNRLTLVRPATIVSVSGNSSDYCIWQAVTPTNRTARVIVCGGENRPRLKGYVLQPGTYTVIPNAGSSITISLTYGTKKSVPKDQSPGTSGNTPGDLAFATPYIGTDCSAQSFLLIVPDGYVAKYFQVRTLETGTGNCPRLQQSFRYMGFAIYDLNRYERFRLETKNKVTWQASPINLKKLSLIAGKYIVEVGNGRNAYLKLAYRLVPLGKKSEKSEPSWNGHRVQKNTGTAIGSEERQDSNVGKGFHDAQPLRDFSGLWGSTEGTVRLIQKGNRITGTYSQDNGTIEGALHGNVLAGYWTETAADRRCNKTRNGRHFWGRVKWIFSGDNLTGFWGYCDDKPTHAWNGHRIQNTNPGNNSVKPGNTTGITGTWKWFDGGTVQINKNGTVHSSLGGNATWKVTHSASGSIYVINWNNGQYIDKLALHGNTLDGHNQGGTHVWGKRYHPGINTNFVSGTYRVTQGHWESTWRVRVVNGRITGTSEWTCCPGHRIDPIRGSVSGNIVIMERNCSGQGWNGPCRQIFRGKIKGNRIMGTCTGTGLGGGSPWVLYLNGGSNNSTILTGNSVQPNGNASGTQNQGLATSQGKLKITGMSTKSSGTDVKGNTGQSNPATSPSGATGKNNSQGKNGPQLGKPYFVVSSKPYAAGQPVHFQAVNIPSSGIQYWVVKHQGRVRKIKNRTANLPYTARESGKYGIAVVYFTSPNDRSLHSLTRWIVVRGASKQAGKTQKTSTGTSQTWGVLKKNKPEKKKIFKEMVCASARPSYTEGGKFKRGRFVIGGTTPQKVRLTSYAANFTLMREDGKIVYSNYHGKSWGSLILKPGTYILSCAGGGAIGTMSATVCIEYPVIQGNASSSNQGISSPGGQTGTPEFGKKEKPVGKKIDSSEPQGPIERIVIRPQDNVTASELIRKTGQEKRLIAWGEDAAGHKKGVAIESWKASAGSINNEGLFRAGQKEGNVSITAEAKNEKGKMIKGTFLIMVSSLPPVIFTGCVKLYDENKNLLTLGGAGVNLEADCYETREDMLQGNNEMWCVDKNVYTNANGEFKFKVPVDSENPFMRLKWKLNKFPIAKPGYYWNRRDIPLSQANPVFSDEAEYLGLMKPGSFIPIAPKGLKCFEGCLIKSQVSLLIDGKVSYHGKPVKGVKVMLFDHGKCVEKGLSDIDGDYQLNISNLPRGQYRLTVKYKPKHHVTLHNLLYIKKDILIDLPLNTEKRTINIRLVSWAEKMGYTGP